MANNVELPLIVAHRGASALAPENTLAAFARAIKDGADGIEFDVQLAKDGVPVVFHDATLQRVARRKIRASSLTSGEMQTLDLGGWFNSRHPRKANDVFSGESVPTLTQVFDFLQNYRGRIYVELKGTPREMPGLVEAIAQTVCRISSPERLVLKSFNLEAVKRARELLPGIRTAALFAPKIKSFLGKQKHLIGQAQIHNASELSLHYSLATHKLVKTAAQENMPVTIWTADHPRWVGRALEIGVRAIITNDPARLIAVRRELTGGTRISA